MKKVFICWSGERAKHVAKGLHKWLPDVLQNVDPWMSEESVAAGARFNREVEERLEATDFGILCITPENQNAPWIHYEAGALGKRVDVSRVVPYLIGMDAPSEVAEGPLTRFQAKVALTQTREVLASLNDTMDKEGVLPDRLDRAYERAWPELKAIIEGSPAPGHSPAAPTSGAMIGEILETVRAMARRPERAYNPPDTTLLIFSRLLLEEVRGSEELNQAGIDVQTLIVTPSGLVSFSYVQNHIPGGSLLRIKAIDYPSFSELARAIAKTIARAVRERSFEVPIGTNASLTQRVEEQDDAAR